MGKINLLLTERLTPTPAGLARAACILRSGGTVAFPTETVYGLGANALDSAALAKVFAAKQRPAWDPLIVHIASIAALPAVAGASPRALTLAHTFWPGPLTLLLPRTPAIPDAVTAGRPLVGVRIPSHPIALELLRLVDLPIAAPSANRFGHTSPTSAQHVLDDLDGRIDAILDGGPTAIGLESTVLDPNTHPMTIYRPGAVTAAMIEVLTGPNSVTTYLPEPSITLSDPSTTLSKSSESFTAFLEPTTAPRESLPAPGVGIRHYAPRARLLLLPGTVDHFATHIANALSPHRSPPYSPRYGLLLPNGWLAPAGAITFAWGPWNDTDILAARLFQGLRQLDNADVDLILCPLPEGEGIPAAIRDRLQKASR